MTSRNTGADAARAAGMSRVALRRRLAGLRHAAVAVDALPEAPEPAEPVALPASEAVAVVALPVAASELRAYSRDEAARHHRLVQRILALQGHKRCHFDTLFSAVARVLSGQPTTAEEFESWSVHRLEHLRAQFEQALMLGAWEPIPAADIWRPKAAQRKRQRKRQPVPVSVTA